MRVLIIMVCEAGHLNPMFPVARQLKERGHEVVFAFENENVDLIRANNFKAVHLPIVLAMNGGFRSIQSQDDKLNKTIERILGWIKNISFVLERERLRVFNEVISSFNPDIILLDSSLTTNYLL